MNEIVKITISSSTNGSRVFSLLAVPGGDGNTCLAISDDSEYRGPLVGERLRRRNVPLEDVDRCFEALSRTQIAVWPQDAIGIDGETTDIRIERGLTRLTFRWFGPTPPGWEGLDVLFRLFD
jgi:hypothetical protein